MGGRHLAVAMVGAMIGMAPAAAADSAASAQHAVQSVLDDSAKAWSAGNLDRFMTCYEDASGTTYVGGGRFVSGYRAIRAVYAARFGGGTAAAMGQLTLSILDFRLLNSDHAYVVGRFHLHRNGVADAEGMTTLLFRSTPQGWRIIADHS